MSGTFETIRVEHQGGGLTVVTLNRPDIANAMNTLPDAPPLVLVSGSPFAPEISARIGAAAFVPMRMSLESVPPHQHIRQQLRRGCSDP